MKPEGFTLVELLVVIAIVAILVAMLAGAALSAWDVWAMTKCQHNLAMQYQAQGNWRAANGAGTYTRSNAWQADLLPYVDNQESVFVCPGGVGEGGGIIGAVAASMYFIIHTIPGIVSPGATPYDAYPITIPLDGSGPWAMMVAKTDEYEEWHVDDGEHLAVGGKGGDDIQFRIYYEDGVPAWVQTFPGGSSSRYEYRYEFYINGELFSRDYFNEYAKNSGRFDLPHTSAGQGRDYGLSKGTFEVNGRPVERVDARLILILDYPQLVADYSSPVGGGDPWDKYFILDPDAWLAKYRKELGEDQTWRSYQSLRHFGMANVLFCDGHVETLSPEELRETDPRWRYGSL
jgi:prepilin-type N-terminal cleavage/methylation domain-containing protein/prepilin-type processing-associated H-X9-DG protein